MNSTIELIGISSPNPPENRTLAHIKVIYKENVYDWKVWISADVSDFNNYLESIRESIEVDIDNKEIEWEALDPKYISQDSVDPETGEIIQIQIPISRESIVKPDLEDWIVKRRSQYPDIAEQLDAIWKGPDSVEFLEMNRKIESVKNKYPKTLLTRDTEKILSERKLSVISNLSKVRSRYESSGITVSGIPVKTDNNSQTKMIGVMMVASQNPNITVNWKAADGRFITLNALQIMNMVLAVKDHIQSCFEWESRIKERVLLSSNLSELLELEKEIEELDNRITK
jgi:hypothetical protein